MRQHHVRLSVLQTLLALEPPEIRELLANVQPLLLRGEPRYRWSDVLPLLPETRRRRVSSQSSRYWVAGYPRLVEEWHPDKNGDLRPEEVSYGSRRRVWWRCPKGPDHEWQAIVESRTTQGTGCPFCAGSRLSITNSLATRAPRIAAEWHPTKNGELTPQSVVAGTVRVVWWKCSQGPDHEWRSSVSNRTWGETGCPFCAARVLSVTNSVATVPAVTAQWHPRNQLTPDQLTLASMKRVWWRCDAGHEWVASPQQRIRLGRGCPYCRGRLLSPERSLVAAAPLVAAEWHPTLNGSITPADVSAGTQRKFFWQCSRVAQHVWSASPNNRAGKGSGCPRCARDRNSLKRIKA